MVVAEIVNCWGMIMLGRWPRTLLGDYESQLRKLTSSQPSSPRLQKTLAVRGHPSPHPLPQQVLWLGCRARLLRASCGDSSLRVAAPRGSRGRRQSLTPTSRRWTWSLYPRVTIPQSQLQSPKLL